LLISGALIVFLNRFGQSYFVEHLATFSTVLPGQQQITPKLALQRLFAMEKTSGIWTQRMAIQVEGAHLLVCDRETNDVVEQFSAQSLQQPVAFSHSNHIYDNILMFVVQHPHELDGKQSTKPPFTLSLSSFNHFRRACEVPTFRTRSPLPSLTFSFVLSVLPDSRHPHLPPPSPRLAHFLRLLPLYNNGVKLSASDPST
jgi:hypothetical protein